MTVSDFGAGVGEQLRAAAGGLYITALDVGTLSADKQLFPGAGFILGYSLREATGAAGAVVELRDGGDAGGTLIFSISLASTASDRFAVPDGGLPLRVALFAHVLSGSMVGSVWVGYPGPNPPLVG